MSASSARSIWVRRLRWRHSRRSVPTGWVCMAGTIPARRSRSSTTEVKRLRRLELTGSYNQPPGRISMKKLLAMIVAAAFASTAFAQKDVTDKKGGTVTDKKGEAVHTKDVKE